MASPDDSSEAAPPNEKSGTPGQSVTAPNKRRRTPTRSNPANSSPEQPEDTQAMSSEGLPHVHAPHGGVHTWRDFFVHVAIIALGLLLALGLEQVAQAIHHAHQRGELEEQMRETFEANARIDKENLQVLGNVRAYYVALHEAVADRQKGEAVHLPTPPRYNYVTLASLGPFAAAQANGTIAVMSVERIGLYNRIAYQHRLLSEAMDNYRHSIRDLRSFRKRFDAASATDNLILTALPPDIAALSDSELIEYRTLIADAIENVDQTSLRIQRQENQYKAVLAGARNEMDLVRATTIDVRGAHSPEINGESK